MVADALVEAAHNGELHGLLDRDLPIVARVEHRIEVLVVQVVEHVIDIADHRGQAGVTVGIGIHSHRSEPHRLLAHPVDEAAHLRLQLDPVNPADGLGDVGHQVAAAFDLGDHPQVGEDGAQVNRHRLLECQQFHALLLGFKAEQVHLIVGGDDLVGTGDVAGQQRNGDRRDALNHHAAHLDEVSADLVHQLMELGSDFFGHGEVPATRPGIASPRGR